jgi:hypothetical protein
VTATPSLLRSKPLTVRTALPRLVGVLGVEATAEVVRRCPDVLASTTLKSAWLALVEVRVRAWNDESGFHVCVRWAHNAANARRSTSEVSRIWQARSEEGRSITWHTASNTDASYISGISSHAL